MSQDQLSLFDSAPAPTPTAADARQRHNWTRTAGAFGYTCGARWTHPAGWQVIHCGHPTALYPYYGVSPDGEVLAAGGYGPGTGFRHLVDAQVAIELEIWKKRSGE